MSQMVFDEGLAARLDAMYQTRDMVRRRRLARAALGVAPGEHVVDVGCGPGFTSPNCSRKSGPAAASSASTPARRCSPWPRAAAPIGPAPGSSRRT
jgi:ubiquinone/menaquinone biosynthesis C-methylase UbiE